jgi:hypothetical protein
MQHACSLPLKVTVKGGPLVPSSQAVCDRMRCCVRRAPPATSSPQRVSQGIVTASQHLLCMTSCLEGLVRVGGVVDEVVADLGLAVSEDWRRNWVRGDGLLYTAHTPSPRPSTRFCSPPLGTLTTGILSSTSFWKRGTELRKSETAMPAPAPQKTADEAKGRSSL